MPEVAIEIHDKQAIYYRRFDKRLRDRLKAMITPELVEEHRQRPLGQHSDTLSRVLNYFRRGEVADKYAIMRQTGKFHSYKIVAFSGVRGAPPRLVDDRVCKDINEAYHAVFLLRVNDLMER
jgi:branched-chain amino acid transport system permease protein